MKLHLCCGTVYLKDFINCDIDGKLTSECTKEEVEVNLTTLDNYFKYPFVVDKSKRVLRQFVIDKKMNILEEWPFEHNSMEEIILVNAIEHFEHKIEVEHIINQACNVLKVGGLFKFDFPDLKKIIELYHESDPEFCMALIYGTHKNKYSRHEWGYTAKSIKNYFLPLNWKLVEWDVVKHDYPSFGIWAMKI